MNQAEISVRFEEDAIADEVACESISIIWQKFTDKLEEIELSELEIPYATEIAMMKIRKMMELAILDHDGLSSDAEALETMTPDGEPYPSTSDPWARGTGRCDTDCASLMRYHLIIFTLALFLFD